MFKSFPIVPFHVCTVDNQPLSSKCQNIKGKAACFAGLCHTNEMS